MTGKSGEIGRVELIALIAAMFSIVAMSVDAMLPALPNIAQDFGLESTTRAALILTTFLFGMGMGTFFAGPLSDSIGRRPVAIWGFMLFLLGAFLAAVAPTMEMMIVARVLQGLGASGPRIACLAIVRDRYSGNEMARLMSFAMMIFLIVPAVAPALGAFILTVAHWRAIFVLFIVMGAAILIWFVTRQAETLKPEDRAPFRFNHILQNAQFMLTTPQACVAILVQMLGFALFFVSLSMAQPIFEDIFDRVDSFPYWFGGLALVSIVASLVNAQLVGRYGMRRLVSVSFVITTVLTTFALLLLIADAPGVFVVYLVWQGWVLMQIGLTAANLNALAVEPMGHAAGLGSSIIAGIATGGGATIASGLAQLYDGTLVPLYSIVLIASLIGLFLMIRLRRVEALA